MIPSPPSISVDGRYIAFSTIDALVSGDTNQEEDAYIHDQETGITVRASVNSKGQQVFASQYRFPRLDQPVGLKESFVSENGRYVAFESSDAYLVQNDVNNKADIFIKDMETGIVTRIDFGNGRDAADPYAWQMLDGITPDGKYLFFTSESTDLVTHDNNSASDVFIRGPFLPEQSPRPQFIPAIPKLLLVSKSTH